MFQVVVDLKMRSTPPIQEELPDADHSHEQPAIEPTPPPEPLLHPHDQHQDLDDSFRADEEAAVFLHGGASASADAPPLLPPAGESPPLAMDEPSYIEQRLHEILSMAHLPTLDGWAVGSALGEIEEMPMTYEVLRASGVGRVLKRWSLSNHDDATRARAKALIARWRGLCTTPGSFGKCFLVLR